jgi:hypothetical protein
MTIKGHNPAGWIEEKIGLQYQDDAVGFAINPTFLKDIVVRLNYCIIGDGKMKFAGDNWQHIIALKG